MRLATFNVENLFARAKALRATSVGEKNRVLSAFERFITVSAKFSYGDAHKATMLEDRLALGVLVRTSSGTLRISRNPSSAWARPGAL